MDPNPPFRLVETAFASYLVIPIKTNQGRCFFCTRGARHGRRRGGRGGRGHLFCGRRERRSPSPRHALPAASSNHSSEHAWMSTPPYTARLVSRSPSPAAQRLSTPTPPEEPPRRRLIVRIRRPGTQAEGVGVIPDMNVPA
jgi:hypothetical protein